MLPLRIIYHHLTTLMHSLKNIFVSVLLFLNMPALAQQEENKLFMADDGLLTFQKVFEVDGSAADLFSKSRLWISEVYGSSEEVLDYVDEENKVMVVKGIIPTTNYGGDVMIHHQMKIETRDGRARMTVNKFVYQGDIGSPRLKFEATGLYKVPRRNRMIEKTEVFLVATAENYSNHLSELVLSDDDW